MKKGCVLAFISLSFPAFCNKDFHVCSRDVLFELPLLKLILPLPLASLRINSKQKVMVEMSRDRPCLETVGFLDNLHRLFKRMILLHVYITDVVFVGFPYPIVAFFG